MVKNSRQREAIRRVLMNTTAHPSAESVYTAVKEEYPNISLGTVYRNLNLLVDLGEIVKVPGTVGQDRFDGNTSRHSHFFCERCNAIIDIEADDQDEATITADNPSIGRITDRIITYRGLCRKCMEEVKENTL